MPKRTWYAYRITSDNSFSVGATLDPDALDKHISNDMVSFGNETLTITRGIVVARTLDEALNAVRAGRLE